MVDKTSTIIATSAADSSSVLHVRNFGSVMSAFLSIRVDYTGVLKHIESLLPHHRKSCEHLRMALSESTPIVQQLMAIINDQLW